QDVVDVDLAQVAHQGLRLGAVGLDLLGGDAGQVLAGDDFRLVNAVEHLEPAIALAIALLLAALALVEPAGLDLRAEVVQLARPVATDPAELPHAGCVTGLVDLT